jgi:hypothetical protein
MDRRKSFAMSNPADTDLPPMLATPCGLYRHYKGGWYQVIDSARCSETLQGMTLYRALYGGFGLWVRPAAMFSEYTGYPGKAQARFVRHEVTQVALTDLAAAQAVVAYLRALAQQGSIDLDRVLRPPPPEPTSCCGRGCNGCVWEGYFTALHLWRDEACVLLAKPRANGQ